MFGKTHCGYQRFKCKNCEHTYTFHNHKNKSNNERTWFKLWVVEGYSLRQLVNISKYGVKKIKRIKKYWLNQKPKEIDWNFSEIKYLLFDGTYFKHENCLMVLMNNLDNTVINFKYHIRENFETAYHIFADLKVRGLNPEAITIDGNTTVIRALNEVWPDIKIQRCLAHVQRQGLSWLRRFPKLEAAKKLRWLLLTITEIKTEKDKNIFIEKFNDWELAYGKFVQSLSPKDKVFGDLQRTRSLLIHAIPKMFYFLNDHRIAATTNKVEGYFSGLKIIYRQHRGLDKQHRDNYFNWYIYFKNIK